MTEPLTPEEASEHPQLAAPQGWTWGRGVVIVILVALVGMWAWIYLFAPRENPDRFQSDLFAEAAEPICAEAQAAINAFPPGHTIATPQDRAVYVRQATEITEQLVNDLKDLLPLVTDPGDRETLTQWFADWEEAYLIDRWAHVARLENATPETPDTELAFLVQERIPGGFYTRRIDGLANVNHMPSCHVPGDI